MFILKKMLTYLTLILLLTEPAISQAYRDTWQKPNEILDTLHVKPGMVVGEVGAGEGYFTLYLSKRVGPTGKIYANDIDKKSLKTLAEKCRDQGFQNIVTIKGKVKDPVFPEKVDLVIMVYVLHDMTDPVHFLRKTTSYLKPGAQVVIVDRDPDRYGSDYDHFLTKQNVLDLVKKAGYMIVRCDTFLPRDNIYIIKPT